MTRARSQIGLAAVLAAALGLACQTSLDLDRAREVVLGTERLETPVLHETPPASVPAPGALRAASGQLREVPLTWEPVPVASAAGYVVERALAPTGPFERIAVRTDRFEASYADRGFDLARKAPEAGNSPGLGDGATYHYRVRAFDASGHVGASASPVATATTAAVPAAPKGLRAYSQLPRKIALAWDPLEDPHVTGYVVLRSPSATGRFEPVTRLDGRFVTTWIDRGLGDLQVFYYRIAAVNAAGGQGTSSDAVRAVTKADPLAPAGLTVVAQSLGRNVLEWTPNVERDVASYRILRRRADGAAPEVVATLPPSATRVEDTNVGAGERVGYTLIAVDADGLQSEESETVEVASRGYDLQAEARNDGVVLSWHRSPEDGFVVARIERGALFGNETIARESGSEYVDRSVSPGRTYRYVVVLERADGTTAPPSAPIEVEVP